MPNAPPTSPAKSPSLNSLTTECACGTGFGWYLLRVPYGDPAWGVLQRCECDAARAGRAEQTTAQVSTDLGALAACTFASFDLARPLPPATWEGQTLGEEAQRKALKRAVFTCQEYAQAPDRWLYLHGAYGAGKSHLAASVAHELAARGFSVRYWSMPGLLDAIKAGFKTGMADVTVHDALTCDLLILDDIGTEHWTGWAREKLFTLLNERLGKLLIMTSNLHPDDLVPPNDVDAGRLASRIAGNARLVWMPISDYRRLPQ